jgi:hypothetical protein
MSNFDAKAKGKATGSSGKFNYRQDIIENDEGFYQMVGCYFYLTSSLQY